MAEGKQAVVLGDENVDFETTKGVKVINTFDAMGLREDLLRGLYAYGFEKPSAIQQRAVVPILNKRDVIAQAQSGTGKTSLIALTLCQLIDTQTREYDPPFCMRGFTNITSISHWFRSAVRVRSDSGETPSRGQPPFQAGR